MYKKTPKSCLSVFRLLVDTLLFRHNFDSCDATPITTLTRKMSLCKLKMVWSVKTRHIMFNCDFYSPSALLNADFPRTNPHACKTSSNHLKTDVASSTSILSALPANVPNTSVLDLLKYVFICWCEYYLTLSSTQILLGLCIQAFRD